MAANTRISDLFKRTVLSGSKVMTDILFAHLHSDSRLEGSFLQGMDFIMTTQALSKYFEALQDDKEFSEVRDTFRTSSERFKDLPKYLKKLNDIPRQFIDEKLSFGSDIAELKTIAQDLLADLDTNGKVFFPGGWIGVSGKSGHAMMFELRKEAGKIIVLVHNTGEGMQFHPKKPDPFKDKYSPVKVFEIEDNEANRLAFTQKGIPQLLMPRVVPKWVTAQTPFSLVKKFDYSGKRLYDEIIPEILTKNLIAYDFLLLDSNVDPRSLNQETLDPRHVTLIRYNDDIWIYGKGPEQKPSLKRIGNIAEIPGLKDLTNQFSIHPKRIGSDPQYNDLYEFIAKNKAHFTRKDPYPPIGAKEPKIDEKTGDESEKLLRIPIGKETPDIKPYVEEYIPGQRSGTCTMRILIAVLRNALPRPVFLKFLYKVKLQSLIDYYQNQKKEGRLSEPMVQALLRPALEKFARHIDQLMTQNKKKQVHFTDEEAKTGRGLIEYITAELDAALLVEKKSAEKEITEPKLDGSATVYTFNVDLKTSAEPKQEAEPIGIGVPQSLPIWDPVKGENFNDFLDRCLKIVLENERNGHSLSIVNGLEKLMLSLPVTRLDFFKQFIDPMILTNKTKEEAEIFAKNSFEKLTQLTGLYRKHTAKHFEFPFPKRIITTMSAVNVARNFNQLYWNAEEYWGNAKNYRIRVPLYMVDREPLIDENNLEEEAQRFYRRFKVPLLIMTQGTDEQKGWKEQAWILGLTKEGTPKLTALNSVPDIRKTDHYRAFEGERLDDWRIPQSLYQEIMEKNAHYCTTEIPTPEGVRRLLSSEHLESSYHRDEDRQKLWATKDSIHFDEPYLLAVREFQALNPSFMASYEYAFDKQYLALQGAFLSEKKDEHKSRSEDNRTKDSLRGYSYSADDYFVDRLKKRFPSLMDKFLKFATSKLGPVSYDSDTRTWIKTSLYNIANGTWDPDAESKDTASRSFDITTGTLETIESLCNDPDFQTVMSEFAFSLKTRDVATHCLEVVNGETFDENSLQLIQSPKERFKKLKVVMQDSGIFGKSIYCLDGSFHPETAHSLSEAHPIIQDTDLNKLLELERLGENVTHLEYRRRIREKIAGIKQKESLLRFAHARVNTGSQITGVAESFMDNPALLREQDSRLFFMLNEFQPDAIGPFLTDNPDYIDKFIDLIQQSVYYFTDGQKIDEPGLFSLQLGATLERYLQDFTEAHKGDDKSSKPLKASLTRLSDYLQGFLSNQLQENNRKLHLPGNKKQILIRQGEIYRVALMRFQTLFEMTGGKFDKDDINTLIEAILFTTTMPKSQSGAEPRTFNPNIARMTEEFLNQCAPLIKTHMDALTKSERNALLTRLLHLLPSNIVSLKRMAEAPLDWQGKYPIFQLRLSDNEIIYFDCQKMIFKRENKSFKPLPDYFYGNKTFVECFGKNERVVEVYDGLDYFCGQFKNEDGYEYRVIAHNPSDIIIQRLFKGQWLQLQDPNLLNSIHLPETLKGGDFQCWAGNSSDGERICHITEKGGPSRVCLSAMSLESNTTARDITTGFFGLLKKHFGFSEKTMIEDLKTYCDTNRPGPLESANQVLQESVYNLNVMKVESLPAEMEQFRQLIPLVIQCQDKLYIYGYPEGKDSGQEPKLTQFASSVAPMPERKRGKDQLGLERKEDQGLLETLPKNQPISIDVNKAFSIYPDIFHDIRKSGGHRQELNDIIYNYDRKIENLLNNASFLAGKILIDYKIIEMVEQSFPDFVPPSFVLYLPSNPWVMREAINEFLMKINTEQALKMNERINALFKSTDDYVSVIKEIWRHRAQHRSLAFMEKQGVFERLETAIKTIGRGPLTPWRVDEEQNKTNYALMDYSNPTGMDKKTLEFFSRIESPAFLEIWKSVPYNKSEPFIVSLPRYKIEFIAKFEPKTEQLYFESKNPPGYQLRIPKIPPESPWVKELPGFETFLPLQRIEDGEVVENLILVPEQQFLPTEKKDMLTGYYKVELDQSNTVVSTLLENRSRKERGLPEPLPREENITSMKNWKLLNTENYRMFSVDAKGKLEGKSAVDLLYLATIQLASHKPEKALETLKNCQKGLEGTKDEIEMLRRIMTEIPFKSGQDRNVGLEHQVMFSYPEVLAVRAFSAYLISQFKYKTKELTPETRPHLQRLTNENYNEYYKKIADERTVQFYNNDFYAEAYIMYREYCGRRGNIPRLEMQLSESEEASLTRQIFYHPEKIFDGRRNIPLWGAPAFRAQVLELRSLERQRRHLLQAQSNASELKEIDANIHELRSKLLHQEPESYPLEPPPKAVVLPKKEDVPYDLAQELGLRAKMEEWSTRFMPDQIRTGETKAIFDSKEIKGEQEAFFAKFMEDTNEDYQEGIKKNADLRNERLGLLEWLKDSSNRKFIEKRLLPVLPVEHKEREPRVGEPQGKLPSGLAEDKELLDKLRKEIEDLAGSKILGDLADEKRRLGLLGRKLVKPRLAAENELLKTEALFALFLQGDFEAYQKKTGLNEDEIKRLHEKIHQYLLLATKLQQKARIAALLKKLDSKKITREEEQALLQELTDQLKAKRSYSLKENAETYPLMLLWEYYEDKLIRPLQKDLISDLLTKVDGQYKSQVIQMLMGGGKTKVLWTLLAMKQADGVTLPIIIVPKALLRPTYNDLVAVTAKFNKKCHAFLFTRDKPIDSKHLELLLRHLQDVIRDREFLITAPESLQALELKFIEVLSDKPNNPNELPEWEKQVKGLSDILRLLRNQSGSLKTTALIDEVDTVLNIRDELNYTIGDEVAIKPETSRTVIQLFNLFGRLPIDIYEVMKKPDVTLGEEEWQKLFDELATLCVTDDESPLFYLCNHLTPIQQTALKKYLLDKAFSTPNFLQDMTPQQKETIDLIKGYLSDILPITLKNKQNLHFGFSKLPERKEYEIAIPYMANNIANESSRFELPEITLAYSLLLHKDPNHEISLATTQKMLINFYDRVEKEMKLALEQGRVLERSQTAAALEFFKSTGEILADISIEDPEQCEAFRKRISTNPSVKDYCLEHYILPNITQHKEVLRNNSHNLMSIIGTVEATSGTLWNRGTYPKFLVFNPRGSLGTDGQTMDLLISQNTPLYGCDEKEPRQLLKALFEKSMHKDSTRAFLDVGAMFTGISNERVARDFLGYIQEKRLPIKFVLYFNEGNELCALPTTVPADKSIPVILKSTQPDYIAKKLDCTPSECFTYYDQWHTTGIDIRQAVNANAFITISEKTLKRDYLQGAFRMRGLASGQTLEASISSEVARKILKKDPSNCDIRDVTKATTVTQMKRLAEDNFVSAIQEIRNYVRDDLMKRILNEVDPQSQHEKLKCCREAFFQKTLDTATAKFGGVKSESETKDLLDEVAKTCFEQWERMARDAGFQLFDKDIQSLTSNIQESVKVNLPKCLKTTRTKAKGVAMPVKQDSTAVAQAQAQRQQQAQTENELQNQIADAGAGCYPAAYDSWNEDDLQYPINRFIKSMTLNAMAWPDPDNESQYYNKTPETYKSPYEWSFSNAIHASSNFMNTHSGQRGDGKDSDYMTHKKPVQFYAIIEDRRDARGSEGPPKYFILLITPEEREQLKARGPSSPDDLMKISIRTAHGFYDSCDKIDTDNEQCKALIEQVAFFNGDAHLLSRNVQTSQWFDRTNPKEVAEKIHYLENTILPSHPEKAQFLSGLQENLAQMGVRRELLFRQPVLAEKPKEGEGLEAVATPGVISTRQRFY